MAREPGDLLRSGTQLPSWKGVILQTRALAAALTATSALLLFTAASAAAPTEVTVRIEGETETLFEGPILTDGHDIRAAGDHTDRPCDGTNGGANPSPGPTPTAAAVDAMAIAGEDFDGRWFAGHDDYYVERWGPDEESYEGAGAFWGVLVEGVLASVGGCQFQLSAGDEALWAYDAFNSTRPFLRLAPEEEGAAGDPNAPVYVDPGEPLELIVQKQVYGGALGEPPTVGPAAGVPVRLVATDPQSRFQAPGAALDVSDAAGAAGVGFDSPGWRRLKAAEDSGYIRSNRLDVCVRTAGGAGCGPLPPDATLRIPPAAPPPGPGEGGGGGGGPGPGGGAARRTALDRLVRFLQNAQNADGGFGARRGGASDPLFSAWAAYALAAAGINPQDQSRPGGVDVHTYLTAHTSGLHQTTDFDRAALVALASGTSPRDFGGVDPIGTILSRQLPDGSFPQLAAGSQGWVNATIWSIFPLSALQAPAAEAAVRRATRWLLDRQRPDGSWPSHSPGSGSDADMTAAAIQALNAAGRHGSAAESLAFEYLRGAQGGDGGFATLPGGASNSATTAWAAQAIWSAGADPRDWRSGKGNDPLAYLAALQRPDGSIGYTATSDLNSLWMTAQAGPALAGRAYPLPAVPRRVVAPERARAVPSVGTALGALPAAARPGAGGKRFERGDGVIAGAGGRGTALFSAPQPQSGGSTPRGARELRPGSPSAGSGRSSAAGAGQAGGAVGGRVRESVAGAARGQEVEGVLLGGGRRPAAPGLLGAGSGGRREPLPALLLVAAIAAAAAIGFRRGRLDE